MLKVPYHRAKFVWSQTSHAAGGTKNVEFLSDCLSIHIILSMVQICSWLPPFCKQNLLFIQPRWQLRRTYFFNLYNVSITLWNGKVCENDFAQMASELRSGFDVVGWGKVCSCVPTFNFVSMPLGGTTAECWSWKCGKFWQFFRLSRTIE